MQLLSLLLKQYLLVGSSISKQSLKGEDNSFHVDQTQGISMSKQPRLHQILQMLFLQCFPNMWLLTWESECCFPQKGSCAGLRPWGLFLGLRLASFLQERPGRPTVSAWMETKLQIQLSLWKVCHASTFLHTSTVCGPCRSCHCGSEKWAPRTADTKKKISASPVPFNTFLQISWFCFLGHPS